MIKSIKMENFKSYEDTKLEFSDGVNCIIGIGDSGKSNITRAIDFVVNNTNKYDKIASDFNDNKKTKVEIEFTDGIVSLEKTKSNAVYKLNGKSYTKFGTKVPIEISNFINMSDLNLRMQFDNHFLLTNTGGEITKEINKIINIEKVDEWTKNINGSINSFSKEQKIIKSDINDIESEIKKYENLNEIEKLVNSHKEISSSIENHVEDRDDLQNLVDDMYELLKRIKFIKEHHKSLDNLQAKFDVYLDMDKEIEQLKLNSEKLLYYINIKEEVDILSEGLEKINIVYTKYEDKEKTLNLLFNEKENILKMINMDLEIKNIESDLMEVKKEYGNTLKDLKICPICSSKISNKKIEEIMEAV